MNTPSSAILKRTSELLKDLGATFEYPGYLSVSRDSDSRIEVGDANECFGYDIIDGDNQVIASEDLLPLTANAEELTAAIRSLIAA